ncbi:MAG TPA: ATP-dependent 6-phosphofructokinase [Nitriliruptoraceae bacterium]|nr:ATP-dependent 6-phosphofructokinase [Nitriliruptoraceae bacterium]
MARSIGILTAGGDAPGLNAAIRAIGKSAVRAHDMKVVGFLDGFRGLLEKRHIRLDSASMSGILTTGGTILGTSRNKVHKMALGGDIMDMRSVMVENAHSLGIDVLVCLGGGGTQKNALRLAKAGMDVITLPKTIDNDVWGTERTFGFDTALNIATEAIDRLHSTAHSHHRLMVVEIMGHNTGWLALASGIAGGADVVLLPEIPYDMDAVANSLMRRKAAGSRFSIIAVSEGALSKKDGERRDEIAAQKADAKGSEEKQAARDAKAEFERGQADHTARLAEELEERTGIEARVTILGHVQRGGTPSPKDRLLATRLGVEATQAAAEGDTRIMIADRDRTAVRVPLDEVAGNRRVVPLDHPWITTARQLGMGLGD